VQIKIGEELDTIRRFYFLVGNKRLGHSSLGNICGKWDLVMKIKKEKG
jgi:hypothetical protein